jgi:hypothetical protein
VFAKGIATDIIADDVPGLGKEDAMNYIFRGLLGPALLSLSFAATADFHLYKIEQVYSNADGTVQYLVMHESMGANGENLWAGNPLVAIPTHGGTPKTFVFPQNLPGGMCSYYGCELAPTAFTRVLIATQGFASLGLVKPDYIVPNGFFSTDGVTINYAGYDQVTFTSIPTDGTSALTRGGTIVPNLATNFAGQSASVSAAVLNFSGLWWKSPAASEDGWGINFSHQGDKMFASWFTYDMTGKGWWLVMSATNTGGNTFTGDLLEGTGPAFDAVPFPPQGSPGGIVGSTVGTGTLTFTDANNGTFAYTVKGISQTKAITRQVFGPLPTCAFSAQNNLAAATNYQDLWWAAPAFSESGWGINFSHQGDKIFATWFTFAHDHTPMWLVVTAEKTAPGIYTGTLFRTTGGPPFNAVAFPPVNTMGGAIFIPVGTATFTFSDGNNASFAYTVDGVSQTKAITRQIFSPPGTVCH